MTTGDDPIEALLRATGRRPAVSADRSRRVHDAARAAWHEEVRRRRVRRRLVRALALTAALALVVLVIRSWRSATAAPAGERVGVERVVNTAWLEQGRIPFLRARSALAEGAGLRRGDAVTTGDDARVALRAATGARLRLDRFTSLRILSARSFFLERGAIYVSSEAGGATGAPSIRVETALGMIEDIGTQFEARLTAGTLSVRVREGTVRVRAGARTESALAGQRISVDRSGRVERDDDPGADAGWAWVELALQMIDIDGRSLAEFLDWAARERGARVRYDEPDLAERAPSIVLRGSVAGMTLDQAVDSVTRASGLVHRWEGRELVVTAGP